MTISANIIADSIGEHGIRITTFELEYPRFCHSEFMTHRLFSRNAASSRAIPVNRAIELVRENTARPIHWGKNQPGMSAKEECDTRLGHQHALGGYSREQWWDRARDAAIEAAREFYDKRYHKQIVNRLLEPFTHIKVVCTATDYDNFFWLRRHPDAQPEIQMLADRMWSAMQASQPTVLACGEWHVPYVDTFTKNGERAYKVGDEVVDLETALLVSASCCAQVSYRKLDDSIEKARDIYQKLIESKPCHASPLEHQATPMNYSHSELLDEAGVTHADRNDVYSGNFRGWIQRRQLISGNVCHNYEDNDIFVPQGVLSAA